MTDFTGLGEVVTGGASGIGAANARELLGRGARVAVLDRDTADAPEGTLAIVADLTDAPAVDAAAASVGPAGILVNSAVIALTKSAGKELATTGVLVNAIAPAVIATPMNATTAPEALAHIASLIPMKRVGTADEVAELVAWLASDAVSFSTGAVYDVSGGRATH